MNLIPNNKTMKLRKRSRRRDVIYQTIIAIAMMPLMLIPTWIFLFAWNKLNPEGFWQTIVTIAIGVSMLGSLQFVLFFLWIGAIVAMSK